MTWFNHMRTRLEQRAGVGLRWQEDRSKEIGARLAQSECLVKFETLMRARLVMGALRYHTLAHQRMRSVPYNRVRAMRRKSDAYEKTGNLELLVDIGNYAGLEFEFGTHPKKHFDASEDTEHCELKNGK